MPKGSAVDDVEKKLKKEYGAANKSAVFGTLNKIGLMKGNKPTAKGLKPAGKGKTPKTEPGLKLGGKLKGMKHKMSDDAMLKKAKM